MDAIAQLRLPSDTPGTRIHDVDLAATAMFSVAAFAAVALPGLLRVPFAVLSCLLFAAGILAFLAAFADAVSRSRTHQVSVAGIFAMAESTPGQVRWRFHALTAVQTAVSIATAAMQPFTAQAFGILVPMLGLGLGGLWASRFGNFEARRDNRHRRPSPVDPGGTA